MNRTAQPSTESSDDWHRHWFDQDYLALYAHRDHREADRFLDLLHTEHGFLPRQPDGRATLVLDLGCGSGRHTLELARRGHQAVGLDWSPELLQVAHAADDTGRFLRADMAHPPLKPVFDWVLSLFTSFGYHAEDSANEAQLARMAGLVRRGGSLVIDYLNPAWLHAHLVPQSESRLGERVVQETRWIDETHNQVIKQMVFPDLQGGIRTVREAVKLYPASWFLERLADQGFRCSAHMGELDGRPWSSGCSRSILVLHQDGSR